jgi:hypothetical protein
MCYLEIGSPQGTSIYNRMQEIFLYQMHVLYLYGQVAY